MSQPENNLQAVKVLAILWGILLTGVVVVFGILILRPFFWHPLGEYPIQTIVAPRDANNVPVVRLADAVVSVNGTKCIDIPPREKITVTGYTQWRRVEGGAITVIAGTAGTNPDRRGGCDTKTYNNIMPSRLTPGLWQITGSESVSGDGFFTGVFQSKSFETEFFRIDP